MTLSPAWSRAAALALAALALAAAIALGALPAWRVYEADREAIAQRRVDIDRYRDIAARGEAMRDTLARLRRPDAAGRLLLPPTSSALAAAALQERVKAIVEDSGGRLTSTQVLPPETEAGFDRVGINVRMSVTTPALQAVLHALESSAPLLTVDEVVVLARQGQRSRTRATQSGLDVRFRISGFMAGRPGGRG